MVRARGGCEPVSRYQIHLRSWSLQKTMPQTNIFRRKICTVIVHKCYYKKIPPKHTPSHQNEPLDRLQIYPRLYYSSSCRSAKHIIMKHCAQRNKFMKRPPGSWPNPWFLGQIPLVPNFIKNDDFIKFSVMRPGGWISFSPHQISVQSSSFQKTNPWHNIFRRKICTVIVHKCY